MTGYVIRSKDTGKYVANPGRNSSYTRDILQARRFPTREAAQADACGSEVVIALADL